MQKLIDILYKGSIATHFLLTLSIVLAASYIDKITGIAWLQWIIIGLYLGTDVWVYFIRDYRKTQ